METEEMSGELERLICNYTRNDRNAINRFLGVAEQCGYHLEKPVKHTRDQMHRYLLYKKLVSDFNEWRKAGEPSSNG